MKRQRIQPLPDQSRRMFGLTSAVLVSFVAAAAGCSEGGDYVVVTEAGATIRHRTMVQCVDNANELTKSGIKAKCIWTGN